MWQVESNALIDDFKFDGKGIGLATGSREVRPDFFISYPLSLGGWNDYIEICAKTENVNAHTSINIEAFNVEKPAVQIAGDWHTCDLLISSISPDYVMDGVYGELNYIGRDFIPVVLPVKQVIPDPTFFLHYASGETYTRVVEYKKLTGYQSAPHLDRYRNPIDPEQALSLPHQGRTGSRTALHRRDAIGQRSVGRPRLGNYRYMDIGNVTLEALEKVSQL